jgi:hypothetical protein
MKVCKKQKLLFIHIPKCGGSSVRQAFNMETLPDNPHIGIQSAIDQCPEMARDYLKFSIIRNPWEAEVSNFFYKLSGDIIAARGGEEHVNAATTGFCGMFKSNLGITCFKPKLIHSHKYGRSMMRFLTDKNDNIAVDEILRLETIDEDIKAMCEKYNLKFAFNRKFTRENWTTHLHYSRYYTEQWMIDYVYEKNKDYIEEFGYEFKEQFY